MGTSETIERGGGGGVKNTPSRFMPLKPEISAALMGHGSYWQWFSLPCRLWYKGDWEIVVVHTGSISVCRSTKPLEEFLPPPQTRPLPHWPRYYFIARISRSFNLLLPVEGYVSCPRAQHSDLVKGLP